MCFATQLPAKGLDLARIDLYRDALVYQVDSKYDAKVVLFANQDSTQSHQRAGQNADLAACDEVWVWLKLTQRKFISQPVNLTIRKYRWQKS